MAQRSAAASPPAASAAAWAQDPAPDYRSPALGDAAPPPRRKRKAEAQDNERLSKRLGLLNLERNGPRTCTPSAIVDPPSPHPGTRRPPASAPLDDTMQLDDTRHKVYIYNIDDELSSDSEADDARLVFLPGMDKRLKESRIPPHILANKDGELAGMQMVLYSDPKSLTVPEDRDGVRRAIVDARRRLRERQRQEREGIAPHDVKMSQSPTMQAVEAQGDGDVDVMDMD